MKTRDWMLKVVKRMKWAAQSANPEWHREEKDFRDWYLGVLGRFGEAAGDPRQYEIFLRIIRLPEMITATGKFVIPK